MEKKKRRLIIIISQCIIGLLPFCLGDKLFYFISDDYLLNAIARGEFGDKFAPFLVFVSSVLGYFIHALYMVFPTINWYGVLLIVSIILCNCIIGCEVSKLTNQIWEIVVILATIEIVAVYHITFTVVAYWYVGTACVYLLCNFLEREKNQISISTVLTFSFLMTLGDMWRKDATITGIIPFLAAILFGTKNYKNLIKAIIVCSIMIGVSRGGNALLYKNNSSSWDEFNSYNVVRSNVVDYSAIGWNGNEENILAIGLSNNDYINLYSWIFADKEVYNEQTLRELTKLASLKQRYNLDLKSIFKKMLLLKYNYWFMGIVVTSLLLCSQKIWINLLTAFLTYGLIGALYVRQRAVMRVMIPIYLLGVLAIVVWTYKEPSKTAKKWLGLIWLGTLVLILVESTKYVRVVNRSILYANYNRYQAMQCIRDYMNENSEYLFVCGGAFSNYLCFSTDIFHDYGEEDAPLQRILKTGSWDIYTPQYYSIAEDYGISDPDRLIVSLSDSDKCLYIESSEQETENILKFLKEHIGENVEYKVIHEFEESDCRILSFYVN